MSTIPFAIVLYTETPGAHLDHGLSPEGWSRTREVLALLRPNLAQRAPKKTSPMGLIDWCEEHWDDAEAEEAEQQLIRRFLRILRGEECCPRCGATENEPCLTWRGEEIEDGTRHQEREGGEKEPEMPVRGLLARRKVLRAMRLLDCHKTLAQAKNKDGDTYQASLCLAKAADLLLRHGEEGEAIEDDPSMPEVNACP